MCTSVFYHFYVQCMCEFSFTASQTSTFSVCLYSCHGLSARTHTHSSLTSSLPVSDLVCIAERSQFLDVPVFLPQDGNLVPEQHRVQPHLGVYQGHESQPVTEGVHAGLSLGEVVRVGPPRRLGALGLETKKDRAKVNEEARHGCQLCGHICLFNQP